MKKGITPVIAIVLLLMMTVASAGLAWMWLQSMQTSTQEQLTEQVKQIGANPFNVISVEKSGTDIKMVLRNKDKASIAGIGAKADIVLKIDNAVASTTDFVDGAGDDNNCLAQTTMDYGETCDLLLTDVTFPDQSETTEIHIITKEGYEITYTCTAQQTQGNFYC